MSSERHPEPPVVRRCAWCTRVHVDGAWRDVVDVAPVADALETHTVCADCFPYAFPELCGGFGPVE